jgi:hypothetical protein
VSQTDPTQTDPTPAAALPAFTEADHEAVAAHLARQQVEYDARKTALAHAVAMQATNDLPAVDDDYTGDVIDEVHDAADRHYHYLMGTAPEVEADEPVTGDAPAAPAEPITQAA